MSEKITINFDKNTCYDFNKIMVDMPSSAYIKSIDITNGNGFVYHHITNKDIKRAEQNKTK